MGEEKTIFLCEKYPYLKIVYKPAEVAEDKFRRSSKLIPGEAIQFDMNTYGVGEYRTADEDKIAFIESRPLYMCGTIYTGLTGQPKNAAPRAPEMQRGAVGRKKLALEPLPAPPEDAKSTPKAAKTPRK